MPVTTIGSDNIIKAGETGIEIVGYGFGGTPGTVSLDGHDMAVQSWSDSSIVVDHDIGKNLRGQGKTLTVTDVVGSIHTLHSVQLDEPASRLGTTFSGALAPRAVVAEGDVVTGDQVEVGILALNTTGGDNAVMTMLRDDCSVSMANPIYGQTYQINVWVGDKSDGLWSPMPSTFEIQVASPTPDSIELIIGGNSLAYLDELRDLSVQMPSLMMVTGVTDGGLKAALVQAYDNLSLVPVNFGDRDLPEHLIGDLLIGDLTREDLLLISPRARRSLLRAQLSEANGVLGGYPAEDKQRMGMLSDKVGESGHFMRPSKPLDLPCYREVYRVLSPYLTSMNPRLAR